MTAFEYIRQHGACHMVNRKDDLSEHLFKAYGIEYLENANLPKEAFLTYKIKGIRTDDFKIENESVVAVDCTGEVNITDNSRVYKVVLLHGAKVKIKAVNHAVVMICPINGTYELDKDDTVVIL